ncbi:hypothetical protein POTOM_055186 [Populus tomentosa]|uniref:FHA domain-containing protein n=1 Tax=Populus tomentosa TaxID=118781 RepID=A0A8X8BZ01_POPTO|nr:hypothetical protein POTOM_055186 [Populus tomentosa]
MNKSHEPGCLQTGMFLYLLVFSKLICRYRLCYALFFLQFKRNGDAYLYDLGSTHGTFINKNRAEKRVYVALHVGDVIRFGHSSQLYIFQEPADVRLLSPYTHK